jgi:hypothetical protein
MIAQLEKALLRLHEKREELGKSVFDTPPANMEQFNKLLGQYLGLGEALAEIDFILKGIENEI